MHLVDEKMRRKTKNKKKNSEKKGEKERVWLLCKRV